MEYDLNRPWLSLDDWQKEVLKTEGNIVMRSGRQVGKSAIISVKVADYAMSNSKKAVMVIAKTERQAQLLFQKILSYITFKDMNVIKMGRDRPTRHELKLRNGTVIYCLPAGDTGYGIMGYTIDLLVADEAAFIPEEVWNSVVPCLAVTRGKIILLSTPFLKEGYYFNCFDDPTFTTFHQSSENSPRRDDEFLAHKKKTLTKEQYGQMYLGEFVTNARQFFPIDLIKATCTLTPGPINPSSRGDYFLGLDVAWMGKDDEAFEVLDGTNPLFITQSHHILRNKIRITETVREVIRLNEQWHFNKIGLDSGGMGVGVLDPLLEENSTKFITVGLDNSKKQIDAEGTQKRLLKEDMYHNLKGLMERGEIKLFNSDEVISSFESILWDENGRIAGNNSHIVEALMRAAYCIKTKGLNLYCSSY